MRRALLAALLAPVALCCITADPARSAAPRTAVAAPPRTPAPSADDPGSEASADVEVRPPPTRRRRDYVLGEKEYRALALSHPRGFQPDDCLRHCRQAAARSASEDGNWTWTLRCALKRNLRDEPVMACREEPVDARPPRRKAGVPSTVVLTDD
jgi:hypothetical protein